MSADTNAGGWPDPTKPGVPMRPEKDGLHWVQCPLHGEVHAWWDTEGWRIFSAFYRPQTAVRRGMHYLGRCLTPSEIAAREQAAFAAGALAMRDKLCAYIDNSGPYFSLADLRALPLPWAAALLRQAREEARREVLGELSDIADHIRADEGEDAARWVKRARLELSPPVAKGEK